MKHRRRLQPQSVLRWSLAATFTTLLALVLVRRHEAPPADAADVCAVFAEKTGWYRATLRSQTRWGVPAAVQLAVMFQESSFRARARPPRRWIWGFIPWRRPSTAYGYAQALDGTWQEYRARAVRPRASRRNFADVVDFVGWYAAELERLNGIARTDAYRLYLAYHEGPAGYARGSHHGKPWLLATARRVASRAAAYQAQLDGCGPQLLRRGWHRRLTTAAALLVVVLTLAIPWLRRHRRLQLPVRWRRAWRRRWRRWRRWRQAR